MSQEHLCISCGADLAGPFQPRISLSQAQPAEGADQEAIQVSALGWICPGCGLVHWYAQDSDLDHLMGLLPDMDEVEAQPGESYERRSQMLRMLRRVRRM